MSNLFTKFQLSTTHTLKNRLVLAPMTNSHSNADGSVSAADLAWYQRVANDGIALIISAAAAVSKEGIGWLNQISVADDSMLPGLTKLATSLKGHSSINLVQLCHTGSRAQTQVNGGITYSASSYEIPQMAGFVPPQELTVKQVYQVIEDFANSCYRVYLAGFDGVEIHGANGYLITQFISTMSNLRTDEFGGSLANRARLVREIVKACRKKVPESFIIGVRLSFENAGLETGLDIDENIQIAQDLVNYGINYIHVSSFDATVRSVKYPDRLPLAYICNKLKNIPIIGVGGATNLTSMQDILAQGADLVGVGRIVIGNPDLELKLRNNVALVTPPYTRDYLTKLGVSSGFLGFLNL